MGPGMRDVRRGNHGHGMSDADAGRSHAEARGMSDADTGTSDVEARGTWDVRRGQEGRGTRDARGRTSYRSSLYLTSLG